MRLIKLQFYFLLYAALRLVGDRIGSHVSVTTSPPLYLVLEAVNDI